jgi:hypothetical protein
VVCQYHASQATTNTNVPVAANKKSRRADSTPGALTMSSTKPRTCGIHLDRSKKSHSAG